MFSNQAFKTHNLNVMEMSQNRPKNSGLASLRFHRLKTQPWLSPHYSIGSVLKRGWMPLGSVLPGQVAPVNAVWWLLSLLQQAPCSKGLVFVTQSEVHDVKWSSWYLTSLNSGSKKGILRDFYYPFYSKLSEFGTVPSISPIHSTNSSSQSVCHRP